MMSARSAGRRGAATVLALLASAGGVAAWAQAPADYPANAVVQPLPSANDPADRLAQALRALSVNPNDLVALTAAGRNALLLGDPNAAVGFFGRASQMSPRDGQTKAGLGAALTQLGQPQQALRLFGEAAALGVTAAEMGADRGLAYDLSGDPTRAQADYRAVLAARPDDDAVRRKLALSEGIVGDRTGAIATLDPLIRKRDIAAWRAQTFVLAMTGDAAGANSITRVMLPQQQAALQPFLIRLAALTPAQKARAVHFGEMPTSGRTPAAAPTQVARTVAAVPAAPPPRAAPVLAARASDLAVPAARTPAPPVAPAPVPAVPVQVASVASRAAVAPSAAAPATVRATGRGIAGEAAWPRRPRQVSDDQAYCRSLHGTTLWIYYARLCRAPLASLALAEPPRRAVTGGAGTAASPLPVAVASVAPVGPGEVASPPAAATQVAAAPEPIATPQPVAAVPVPVPVAASAAVAVPTQAAVAGSPSAATASTMPVPATTAPAPAFPGLPTASGTGHYDLPHDAAPRAARSTPARPAAPSTTVPPRAAAVAVPTNRAADASVRPSATSEPSVVPTGVVAGPAPARRAAAASVPPRTSSEPAAATRSGRPSPDGPPAPRIATRGALGANPKARADRTTGTEPSPTPESPGARRSATSRDTDAAVRSGRAAGDQAATSDRKGSGTERKRAAVSKASATTAGRETADATGDDADAPKTANARGATGPGKTARGKDRQATDPSDRASETKRTAGRTPGKPAAGKAADTARVYVQVAGGANRTDMDKAWDGVRRKAPDLMKGKAPSTTPLRATNRLLVGPFKDEDEAQSFVNKMAGKGLSGFVFKSAKGQKVDKIDASK